MRRIRQLHADDQGTTLLEMVVGMGLLAAFMVMFTGAMLLMSNTVNKVEAITSTSGQLNDTFLALDSSMRYGTGISPSAQSPTSGDWHVEFSMVLPADRRADTTAPTNTTQCVQLRVDGTQLQKRTWRPDTLGAGYAAGSLAEWQTLVTNVQNPSADPFSVPSPSGASSSYQQLKITLTASSPTNTTNLGHSSMTFTALNSDATLSLPVCQQISVDATS